LQETTGTATGWRKEFWKGSLRKKAKKMIEFIFGLFLGICGGILFTLLALVQGWIETKQKGGKNGH